MSRGAYVVVDITTDQRVGELLHELSILDDGSNAAILRGL